MCLGGFWGGFLGEFSKMSIADQIAPLAHRNKNTAIIAKQKIALAASKTIPQIKMPTEKKNVWFCFTVNAEMYYNSGLREITMDMDDVNRYRNRIHSESGSRACFPLRRNSNNGCKNEAQCLRINEELDAKERKLGRLRRKYDLGEFGRNRFDMMYMIDPSIDDGPIETNIDQVFGVGLPRTTLSTCPSRGPTKLSADYLINPNHTVPVEDEQWTYEPGSESIVRRKRDLHERQKLRIYPHMYSQQEVKKREAAQNMQQRQRIETIPTEIRGGTDYPIPMYFELTPLQSMQSGGIGVDYDIRLQQQSATLPVWNNNTLPNQLSVQTNVDFDRASQTRHLQQPIIAGSLEQHHNSLQGQPMRPGKPQPLHKDYSCQQTRRQKAQNDAVEAQPKEWYLSNENWVGNGCRAKPRLVEPQSMTERNVFGAKEPNLTTLPQGPQYPLAIDQPSGFFELGPALPPPNPLLLSTIPSSLLMYNQAINSTGNRDADAQLRLSTDPNPTSTPTKENFSSGSGSANPVVEGAEKTGIFTTLKPITAQPGMPGMPGMNVNMKYPSKQTGQPRPDQSTAIGSGMQPDTTEFHVARTSLEAEMKQIVQASIGQQTAALMQISDLRHDLAGLQQRIVEDRARSDVAGVAKGTFQLEEGTKSIASLREIIHAVQTRRAGAMAKLKELLTEAEYGSLESTAANQIKLMETKVKQYHSQPADDAIECHAQPHFGGDGYIMKQGFYDYPTVGGIGYNKLKSLKVGKNVQVKLYQLANRKGNVITYIGPRRISLLPTLWDVAVSGIEVLPKTGPVVDCYDAPSFQGGHVRLPVGFYDYPDVGGIGAGKLASIVIPDGLQVTFYSRPKGQGERIVFLGPQKMSFLTSDWNTKVFGITVATR